MSHTMAQLSGKNIVLGVTGCIAVYKAAELLRLLVKAGANVDVVMTKSAMEFVTPLTFSTLSKNKVHTSMFDMPDEYSINHISLADKADLVLIAPATANFVGKVKAGIADDLLTTVVMATRAPVLIAPAMNVNMWNNKIVKDNISSLALNGYGFIYPDDGELACGYEGIGRLKDIDSIFNEVVGLLNPKKKLDKKKILVTIGGTKEYIDPVRYITNKSSGKMGQAIVEEAIKAGAEVIAISTVDLKIPGAEVIMVESASEMLNELKKYFPGVDVLIMAAAVSDYKVSNYSENKIKKENQNQEITLDLVKNPDLISEMAKIKHEHQVIVGFAAETDNLINNAIQKLLSKKMDIIVANDVSRNDIGFGSDFNEVSFLFPDGREEKISKTSKINVANHLLGSISEVLNKS